MKYQGWYRFIMPFIVATLASCGRSSDLAQDQSAELQAALSSQLGDSALSNVEAQAEMRAVTDEVQNALALALVPNYQETAISNRAISALGCNPKIKLVLIGVAIEFTSSATCHLNGNIAIRTLPLRATADIDVVGLSFVQKLSFDANLSLANGLSGSTLNIQYENAKFSLKSLPILPLENVVSSGVAAISFGASGLQVDSRINAFEETTGLGVAFIAKISSDSRTVQSCLLSSGSATDPQAGRLGACFRI